MSLLSRSVGWALGACSLGLRSRSGFGSCGGSVVEQSRTRPTSPVEPTALSARIFTCVLSSIASFSDRAVFRSAGRGSLGVVRPLIPHMIALRFSLNGNKLCLAGLDEPGIITGFLNYMSGIHPDDRPGDHTITVRVAGLRRRGDRHVVWAGSRLQVGDQVLVEIVETTRADRPKPAPRPTASKRSAARSSKATRVSRTRRPNTEG